MFILWFIYENRGHKQLPKWDPVRLLPANGQQLRKQISWKKLNNTCRLDSRVIRDLIILYLFLCFFFLKNIETYCFKSMTSSYHDTSFRCVVNKCCSILLPKPNTTLVLCSLYKQPQESQHRNCIKCMVHFTHLNWNVYIECLYWYILNVYSFITFIPFLIVEKWRCNSKVYNAEIK